MKSGDFVLCRRTDISVNPVLSNLKSSKKSPIRSCAVVRNAKNNRWYELSAEGPGWSLKAAGFISPIIKNLRPALPILPLLHQRNRKRLPTQKVQKKNLPPRKLLHRIVLRRPRKNSFPSLQFRCNHDSSFHRLYRHAV